MPTAGATGASGVSAAATATASGVTATLGANADYLHFSDTGHQAVYNDLVSKVPALLGA